MVIQFVVNHREGTVREVVDAVGLDHFNTNIERFDGGEGVIVTCHDHWGRQKTSEFLRGLQEKGIVAKVHQGYVGHNPEILGAHEMEVGEEIPWPI